MGANLFLVSSSGLDTGSSIDLSPGETMVWTGDYNITDIDFGFNGDAGTCSFGTTGGPGAFTSTNTSNGTFTYELTYADWIAAGLPSTITFQFGTDYDSGLVGGAPGTTNTPITITCFHGGTQIATPDGERAVETLAIGDLVTTADGAQVPVKWLGRQTVRTLLNTSPKMQPVRIHTGALGNGLPHSDLTVTADHGMLVDGYVINAGALVNGTTIRELGLDEVAADYVVYHIETEAHDAVVANGAPAETFIDYVGRLNFENCQEYIDLYGANRIIPEMPYTRVSSARLVPQVIKDRLGIEDQVLDLIA